MSFDGTSRLLRLRAPRSRQRRSLTWSCGSGNHATKACSPSATTTNVRWTKAGATNGSAGVHSASGVVGPIRDDWVLGVAGGEIPWLGTVKLMVGGPQSYGTRDVPSMSFIALFAVLAGVVFAPAVSEKAFRWWLNRSPELDRVGQNAREHDDEAS